MNRDGAADDYWLRKIVPKRSLLICCCRRSVRVDHVSDRYCWVAPLTIHRIEKPNFFKTLNVTDN